MKLKDILRGVERLFEPYRVRAVFDYRDFPVSAALFENGDAIRTEYLEYIRFHTPPPIQEISREQKAITDGRKLWKAVFLQGFYRKNRHLEEHFGKTFAFLAKDRQIVSAFFSVLESGADIPEHRGKYAGLLRTQLCIVSPPGDSALEVDGMPIRMETGEVCVFDDTFPHRAWNRSAGERVVFIVDFCRPLPFRLRWINKICLYLIANSPYIKQTQKNLKRQHTP